MIPTSPMIPMGQGLEQQLLLMLLQQLIGGGDGGELGEEDLLLKLRRGFGPAGFPGDVAGRSNVPTAPGGGLNDGGDVPSDPELMAALYAMQKRAALRAALGGSNPGGGGGRISKPGGGL